MFKCLADMEEMGYIRRKQRFMNRENGRIRQYSSLVTFTLSGIRYLVSQKVEGARNLMRRMLDWLKRKDGRFPDADDLAAGPSPEQAAQNREMIGRLIAGIT